jgi:hypothetical protein
MTYTFITIYRGGSYIEQIAASDVLEAAHLWAERILATAIEGLDAAAFRETFAEDIAEFPPTPIDGRPNVWYMFFFSGRKRMEVHIVKTATEYEEPAGRFVQAERVAV